MKIVAVLLLAVLLGGCGFPRCGVMLPCERGEIAK